MSKISIYTKASETKNGKVIDMDLFLDSIQNGKWQDIVLPIRAMKDKDERTAAKKRVPYVTVSGTFRERNNKGLLEPSGFIAIDIDNVDPEEVKSIVCADRHVYSAFTSISGKGLCLIFRIDPKKHSEAFEGIQEYLFTNFQIIIDPSGKDISRPRFISFDPHINTNPTATRFTSYHKPIKALTKIPTVVYVQNDFDSVVREIVARRIDITGAYHQWLAIAYGLADKFGETGRSYFHDISQFSHLYNRGSADKQYTACLSRSASSRTATIGTVIYLAKQAGIQTTSERTKLITQTAALAKKGRRTKEDTIALLQDVEGIKPEESRDIIDQVFENNIQASLEDSPIEALECWLKQNYELKRNIISRKVECNGVDCDTEELNSLFISAKKVFDKEVTYDLFERVIFSNFTPAYNPILDFFEINKHRQPKGVIKDFFDCIETDTGTDGDNFFPDYVNYFGTKWLVSIVAAAYGTYSPLMMVLTGKQRNGKTEFFRRLLPKELQPYFAESKMQAGKDDEILMSSKLVIFDDEMSGKNQQEEKKMKYLLSKDKITLREPYRKYNVDLKRLAVFCGTTNEEEVLHDTTGNRRFIPIHVLSINYDKINGIDRTDLFIEALHLYKSGFNYELNSHDVNILKANTSRFESYSFEYEMIIRYYRRPKPGEQPDNRTASDIVAALERLTGKRGINKDRIGKELKRIGFEQKNARINGAPKKVWHVVEDRHNDGILFNNDTQNLFRT